MSMSTMAVTFRLMLDVLDPAEITAAMGLAPTHAHAKDDPMMNPSGTEQRGIYSEGLWSKSSSLGETDSVSAHIEQLLTLVKGGRDLFDRVKREGGRVDIFVGGRIDDGNGGFTLPAAIMEQLGALGIDLELDLYGNDEPRMA